MLRTAAMALTTALALLMAGCATPDPQPAHPLHAAPVDAISGLAVTHELLLTEMSDATVVYLGEKHDNSQHHELQLRTLRNLIARGHRPLLGLEMFPTTQTSALMEYTTALSRIADPDSAAQRLKATTGMQADGDLRWSRYGPLLRLAREHKLIVFGIDLPTSLRRRVSRVGIEGLTPMERLALPPLNEQRVAPDDGAAYREQMLSRLKAAHCGHGSRAYLLRLFENWQARNETMARVIAAAASARGDAPVLIVVGGLHVRNGEGVVPRLARHLPGARQLIVSLVEADEHRALSAERHRLTTHSVGDSGKYKEVLWATAALGQSMEDACKAFQHANKKSSES